MTDARAYWEREAERHASVAYKYHEAGSGVRYPNYELRRDRLLELLGGSNGRTLLDAGCGTARLLIECLRRGWDGVGCDASPKMIEIARRELAGAGMSPDRAVQGDVTDLSPYDTHAFDAIICMGVLEYLTPEEEAAAFRGFARILRPRGSLFVENINSLFDLVTFNRFTLRFFDEHFIPLFFEERERDRISDQLKTLLTHPDKPDRSGVYSATRDQVHTKSENPLIYWEKVRGYGFTEVPVAM